MASGLEENLLALVYDRFTEGFETHDLRMAKSLIDKLEAV